MPSSRGTHRQRCQGQPRASVQQRSDSSSIALFQPSGRAARSQRSCSHTLHAVPPLINAVFINSAQLEGWGTSLWKPPGASAQRGCLGAACCLHFTVSKDYTELLQTQRPPTKQKLLLALWFSSSSLLLLPNFTAWKRNLFSWWRIPHTRKEDSALWGKCYSLKEIHPTK